MLSAIQSKENSRSVKDEVDLRGYCLNCIKKHAAMTQGLLKEVQQRLSQGSPTSDEKVKKKMAEAMEQIIHIEDHSNVPVKLDQKSAHLLSQISTKANEIRGIIKSQEWAIRVPEHVPKGDIQDIAFMRMKLDELQLVVDKGIFDYGCGDCSLDGYRKKIKKVDLTAPIVDDKFINNSLSKSTRGKYMSQVEKVVNTVFRSYSRFADSYIDKLGIDGSQLTSSLFSNIVGSFSGVGMDILFNPGFSLIAETLAGLGIMLASGKYVRDSRAKMEWSNIGAFMFTRILRAGVAEISQATSQLGSLGKIALSNPRYAVQVPFRSPDEIQSIVKSRARLVNGLNPTKMLSAGSSLRQIVTPDVINEAPISPVRDFPTY